jgi:hypothetical protein
MTQLARGTILALTLLFAPATWSAEFVVLESTSAKYTAGQLLAAVDAVKLFEGEKLTVLSEDGNSYQHKGPYEGPLASKRKEDGTTVLQALGQLVGASQGDSRSMGAIRGDRKGASDSGQAGYDSPAWVILPQMNGTQCVIQGKAPKFWRKDAAQPTRLFLKQTGQSDSMEIAWPAAEQELEWPASVPLEPGTPYLVRLGDAIRSQSLVVEEVPASVEGQVEIVAWLEARGCHRQARSVFASFSEDGN